jgi:hypothetical protein
MGKRQKIQTITSQNVQQKSTNLTLLVMFVFVSCFPVSEISTAATVPTYLRKSFSVLSSVSVTFLSKWRLRELPTATGFSVI